MSLQPCADCIFKLHPFTDVKSIPGSGELLSNLQMFDIRNPSVIFNKFVFIDNQLDSYKSIELKEKNKQNRLIFVCSSCLTGLRHCPMCR